MKFPAAKHTFDYIITLEIVFVQSIARIKCVGKRLGKKKKKKIEGLAMTTQTSEGGKSQERNWR